MRAAGCRAPRRASGAWNEAQTLWSGWETAWGLGREEGPGTRPPEPRGVGKRGERGRGARWVVPTKVPAARPPALAGVLCSFVVCFLFLNSSLNLNY